MGLAASPGWRRGAVSVWRRHPQPASTLVVQSVPAGPRWVSSKVWVSGGPAFTSPRAASGAGHTSAWGGGFATPSARRVRRVFMAADIAVVRGPDNAGRRRGGAERAQGGSPVRLILPSPASLSFLLVLGWRLGSGFCGRLLRRPVGVFECLGQRGERLT